MDINAGSDFTASAALRQRRAFDVAQMRSQWPVVRMTE